MKLLLDGKPFEIPFGVEKLNLISGSNSTVSLATNRNERRLDVTVASTGGGGLSDADYGDVTVSGGGTVMTIDANAVTFSKMQAVSADVLLGNDASGTAVEEIACTAAGRALIDDANAAAQRTTLGLGTLATQSGTFSGTSSGTNTGDQTITLTGDVTGTGTGSFTATIANDAVTDAKLRNSGALSVIGRSANSTGDPADISAASSGDYLAVKGTTLGFQAYQGTSFPSSPFNGQLFLRTDLDYELFYYDAGRTAWLSVRTFELAFTNQTTVSAGNNLRLFQGPVGSASDGYKTKWTCVLTEIVGHRVTSGSATDIYLRDGVTNLKTHTIGSGVVDNTETGLNVAVGSGVILNAYANTAVTGGGWIIYTFRRSAT